VIFLFDLGLLAAIYPNFCLSFVHLDSTRDFHVFSFDARRMGEFEIGDVGGIQPVKVWVGSAAPISRNMFPALLMTTLATTPSTVTYSPT
jgi:hypothetical protein